MKGGEGEEAHRATFFARLQELLGEFSGFWEEKLPLTGLDKTLTSSLDRYPSTYHCVRLNVWMNVM
jgi:hypothetical protein